MPSGSLVLFDIYGTLMRGAGEHHKRALIEGVKKLTGCVVSFEGIATAGSLDRDLIVSMLRVQGWRERAIRNLLVRAMRECNARYQDGCPQDLSRFVCQDVRTTLEAIQCRGIPIGLVSGNLTDIGWKKVELAGLRPFFHFAAFAEDGRSRARLAKIARQRAVRLNLATKDSRVSLVGDHTNDVEAARKNGFQSIAVATGVLSQEELAQSGPDILISRLGELDLDLL